jgi:serine/threonine-protein kinase
MALTSGTRFGSYEVTAPIGVGGMGEVYRARDTNLKRDVAIKVLPESFTGDADRLARFRREGEVLGSLNHANIAQVYGLEKAAGKTVIVMELVEGPTLAERIAQGPLPPDEALDIARQVADALEAAHGRQVVHRDLKPANVKIKPDGTVKVLDFGIAKAVDAQAISGGRSPAVVTPAVTETGVILGTAAYMSPEQARGKPVDQRTDVWAFGCLLFEMLTGQPAFGGEDVMLTLARVLDRDTDLSSIPGTISPAVRHTIQLCLEKNPKRRIADIRDVRLALEGVFESEASRGGRGVDERPVSRRALPHAGTALIVAGLVALAASLLWPDPPAVPAVTRFSITPSADAPLANLAGFDIAISPDGRRLAYVVEGNRPNEVAIYVRDLDTLEARRLPGTNVEYREGSLNPFFSADGAWIGFWSEGVGIMRVPVEGGPAVKILDDTPFRGATVTPDGTLLYATIAGIFRVSAGGGGRPERLTPEPEPTPGAPAFIYTTPVLLPGERAVLFTRFTVAEQRFYLVTLDLRTREQKVLVEDALLATYTATGHLVFARGATLMAVPFDPETLTVSGDGVALFGVRATALAATDYALSANGTLVYVPGAETSRAGRIVWVDRDGDVAERPLIEPVDNARDPRLSPDGSRLALTTGGINAGALWIYDLRGRPAIPLADDGDSRIGRWSPDGARVAFASDRTGAYEPYVLPADGSVRDPVPLRPDGLTGLPQAWSADGELISARARFNGPIVEDVDIVAVRADSDEPPRDVVVTSDFEFDAALAPNGRWLAYVSSRTDPPEIWVKGYPDGVAERISSGGGREPVWSRDGRELFYLRETMMMAVPVRMDTTFSFEPAVELFESRYFITQATRALAYSYDVGPDGRFLMIEPPGATAGADESGSIVIVQNWFEELKQLAPTK